MADDKELLVRIKGLDELTPVLTKALASMEAAAAKLADSVDKISPPLDNARKGAEGLNTGIINLAGGIQIVKTVAEAASKIWEKMAESVHHAVDEALEAEQATNQLTGALVSQGLYTEETVKSINKYVEATERQTGVSGEAIQKMIAMGLQMGLSAEQAKGMEEAARKLAAATGTDVLSAFSQMQGALNGQTRGLAKVLPGVKELTEAQLKQGGAITLVNTQLDAQYKLYQGSFAASLEKAKNSLSNVYEAVGKIIIQNPLVIKGVQAFGDYMVKLQGAVEQADKWIRDNEQTIIRFGKAVLIAAGAIATTVTVIKTMSFATAVFEALATSIQLYGVAGTLAANGINFAAMATGALKTAITFLTGPIGLVILAATALTAAFYKWPGLFDQITGAFKIFVGYFLQGVSWIAEKTAKLVSIFDKDLAKSLENVAAGIDSQSDKWKLAGSRQMDYGDQVNKTADIAVAATNRENDALDENLKRQNARNLAAKNHAAIYDGINIGTEKQREALKAETQDRDKNLKDFTDWLEAKKRIAVDKETEQSNEVAKVRADAMKDSGGGQGAAAGKSVELAAEEKKQSDLKVMRDQGILNEAQYQEAILASEQRYAALRLQQAQANDEALAATLGTSEEGYQLKRQLEEERFQLELQQRMERAQQQGASEAEINSMEENAKMEHLAKMNNDQEAYYNNEAAMLEASGDRWAANGARIRAEQVKHGTVMGTLRAVQQTEEYKGTQQFLTDLGSLRNSKSKKAFEVGKKAALVQASINTFMAATSAYSAMAAIPIVGPALGAIAAAAAIAAGFVNIQKINAQQFDGGQADEGMNSVPGSLAGKSFVLSQGERVVQPEANKDLTNFLDKEKGGASGARGGQTINITLNYGGMGDTKDARNMAEILVKEIRSMSERGTPIISDKGIVKS